MSQHVPTQSTLHESRKLLEGSLLSHLTDRILPLVQGGQVRLESNNRHLFDLIERRYPIGVNRIDWSGISDHWAYDVLPATRGDLGRDDIESALEHCRAMLSERLHRLGATLEDQIVWAGDGEDTCIYMNLEAMWMLYSSLFVIPEHHYVLPLSADWCVNYTMEGQLFVGESSKAAYQGWRPDA